MTNKQVAEMYAEGKIKGTAPHMFIDGDTIYSYGYHFPIATKVRDGVYLFNIDGYSNTTVRHKSHVLNALLSTGARVIEARAVGDGRRALEVSIEVLQREFDYARGKATRARSEGMARVWANEMRRYDSMIELAKTL